MRLQSYRWAGALLMIGINCFVWEPS